MEKVLYVRMSVITSVTEIIGDDHFSSPVRPNSAYMNTRWYLVV